MDMSDPDQIAGVSEHSQQVALLSACAQLQQVNLPNVNPLRWLFAIPNGGDRNMSVAANMKAEGVKSGVADLCLPAPRRGYHGFYIEMKNATGTQSAKQKEFEVFVTAEGYLYGLFRDWKSALKALLWYLDLSINILQASCPTMSWISRLDQSKVT